MNNPMNSELGKAVIQQFVALLWVSFVLVAFVFLNKVQAQGGESSKKVVKSTVQKTQKTASKKEKVKNSGLGTNFDFEDLMVKGKYQTPLDSTTIVENEKDINELVTPRTNFKDRLQRSRDRF